MGIFSFLKKKENPQTTATNTTSQVRSSNSRMVESEEKPKRNVILQPEHIVLTSVRNIMTQGVNAEYYFSGDADNSSATMALMTPINVDPERAAINGVPGKNEFEAHCFLIAENEKYRFYAYGCYPDKSGGCVIRQTLAKPEETVFFGKNREKSCIFHNYLFQISRSAYANELYLYAKNIETGELKIYPWFGKYSIPTGRGSRYDQDHIQSMTTDVESDTIIIDVTREYCPYANQNDTEAICNADTAYTMTIKYNGSDFNATAEFPELNVGVVFQNNY